MLSLLQCRFTSKFFLKINIMNVKNTSKIRILAQPSSNIAGTDIPYMNPTKTIFLSLFGLMHSGYCWKICSQYPHCLHTVPFLPVAHSQQNVHIGETGSFDIGIFSSGCFPYSRQLLLSSNLTLISTSCTSIFRLSFKQTNRGT